MAFGVYLSIFGLYFQIGEGETAMQKTYEFDHVILSPEKQAPLHTQETWELSYVVVGEGMRTLGDDTGRFSAGDLILVPPGMPHCWEFVVKPGDVPVIENMTFRFGDRLLDALAVAFPALSEQISSFRLIVSAQSFEGEHKRALKEALSDFLAEEKPEEVCVVSLLSRLFRAVSYAVGSGYIPKNTALWRISRIETFVSCNYMRRITLEDAAAHVGMNRSAFCTFFKRHTGETFFSYLNRVRLENAYALLLWNERNVSEACWHCGFNDIAYFSRMFKRHFGVSPSKIDF